MAKPIRLTRKRQQWVKGRTTELKGTVLRHNISCEERYARRLQTLSDKMAEDVRKTINALLFESEAGKAYFGQDASIASQARIMLNQLSGKYNKAFKDLAKPAAKAMLNSVNQASKSNLFCSFKKMSGGLSIKTDFVTEELSDIMNATLTENDDLVQSLSVEYMQRIRGHVIRSITTPERGGLTELKKRINATLTKEQRKVHNRAKNIALDQTRKAYNNLNAGRMKAVASHSTNGYTAGRVRNLGNTTCMY